MKVIGQIIEKTPEKAVLSYHEEPLTFYMNDIEKITDGSEIPEVNIPLITTEKPAQFLGHTYIPLDLIIPADEMNYKISHFYADPSEQLLIDYLSFLMTNPNGILNKITDWYPKVHFFAAAAKSNENLIEKYQILESEIKEPYKKEISRIIYLAKNVPPVPRVEDYFDLDFLWSEFFVSGESGPVEKIIDVLAFMNLDPKLPLEEQEIAYTYGRVGFWSLVSNMSQHARLVDIVRKQIAERSGLSKTRLEMAMCRYYQDDEEYDEALACFNNILKNDIRIPPVCDIYLYLGQVYLKKNDKDNALRQYNKLKEINKILAESLYKEINKD